MKPVSPIASQAADLFQDIDHESSLWSANIAGVHVHAYIAAGCLWLVTDLQQRARAAFIPVYAYAGELRLLRSRTGTTWADFYLESVSGKYHVRVDLAGGTYPGLRYTTKFRPAAAIVIPSAPRDVVIVGKGGRPEQTAGKIHTVQRGGRSGLLYLSFTRPKAGSLLYFQNLSALNPYCEQTQTSCLDAVGGNWPELGFALPVSADKPLVPNKPVVLNDAFILFSQEIPVNEQAMVRQYLGFLAETYLQIPRPKPTYRDWPVILKKGLKDLHHPGCITHINNHLYFNAYLSDYKTPPEIMVQLAILLPLNDYMSWSGKVVAIAEDIRKAIPTFVDEKLKVIKRWLPAAEQELNGEEEQKIPGVMDAWYLHHPLLNLSRLALKGDEMAKDIFLDSLYYTVRVARHFDYNWPVFYKMDTLEVVKQETEPGKGGEKDVPGLYATVMLQAYDLTGENRYLLEAKRAAKKLAGRGFELFYQANNTAFTACALLRLAKITGDNQYQELSYLCMANMFDNMHLWECDYGHGKAYPSFFSLYPLKDAPYTAAYEESEVFCAFHEYLKLGAGMKLIRPMKILVSEFIRYMVDRSVFYYPPMLPDDMLEEEVKTGELNPKLWVVLEDIHDGWEKSGGVGQEVYGAGNAFGVAPRHYIRVPEETFMIFCDYPHHRVVHRKSSVSFSVLGDREMECRVRVVNMPGNRQSSLRIKASGRWMPERKSSTPEWIITGDTRVTIYWN